MASDADRLLLRALRLSDEGDVVTAQQVMAREGFPFALGRDDGLPFADYLKKLEDAQHGRGLPEGWVPSTVLLAEVDGRVVGRLSLRHRLNDYLERVAGHIGFGVLPEYRDYGYAQAMLKQGLSLAAALGLTRVLVMCDEPNLASRRVIEKCGGVYADSYVGSELEWPVRRYWLATV